MLGEIAEEHRVHADTQSEPMMTATVRRIQKAAIVSAPFPLVRAIDGRLGRIRRHYGVARD
jgi:hypothetical protein